ncbi:hypothetical protein [Nocardioides psychrotolerans]|uniref:hypothetical protein n=1 Tax=Nocardioides psychrotolerans TaxID=1005945 RepID=UPI0011607E7F|nr:hypothetical protein [Nocardioides psychrotolerans]
MLSFVLGVAALVTAPFAAARDDDGVDRETCSVSSSTRLRVDSDGDGRLVVIGVVWSDDEDVWEWRMLHDGEFSARGETRAKDADRSLRIRRLMIDFTGSDVVVFRAENMRTREVCRVDVVT